MAFTEILVHTDDDEIPQVEVIHFVSPTTGVRPFWAVKIRTESGQISYYCHNLSQVRALAPNADIEEV